MRFFLVLIILFNKHYINANATNGEIISAKSKEYKKAQNLIKKGKYKSSKELLKSLISKNPNFIEARVLLAKINQKQGKFISAKNILKETIRILPKNKKSFKIYYDIAYIYYRCGMYKESKDILEKITNKNSKKIRLLRESIDFSLKELKKNKEFNLNRLPKPLNTLAAQYFPILTLDQKTIIFTGRKNHTIGAEESLYISKFRKGKWSIPKILSNRINTKNNEGACTISSDGKLLIFSAYNRRENIGSCDLYISYKKRGSWSFPKNLGPNINSKGWQSQPSLSPDSKVLYFASKRKGNIGKKDIWRSEFKNGKWQKAKNLGMVINSRGNETSPFIHPNNKILYFASDRSPSLGGLNIYFSRFKNDKWTTPKNIGYPINNYKDQVSIFITADGKKGYFAQGNQKGIYYNGILYEFDIPDEAKIEETCIIIKGKTSPKEMEDALKTKLYIYDNKKEEIIYNIDIGDTGKYIIPLVKDKKYDLIFLKKDNEVKVIQLNLKNRNKKIISLKKINFKKLKKGNFLYFKNILFDFDKYDIKKDFLGTLKGIVLFLKENPSINILVQGFTDYKGKILYNKKLSHKRAFVIYNFLLKEGVNKNQLSYKGLGKIQPIDKNDTDEQKRSRKVCFKIL